ncbi:MAG: hypothetical protein A2W93_09955 [Bacteroidetes bacterium GWF2_43_63]|nr:MAG: hypothetical protein A2W94_02510 [Bacteroidetes bacterium GWE2_42_42]OFY52846.1 MAG: hypothetical protein A2W93_09955 [Bacteroidetes bacterium GWF2_43_63]
MSENDIIMINKSNISARRRQIEEACAKLKNEFFGIDSVIDSLCRNIESWVLFPDMQERPLIINLWGMTGVGKTALVKRLAELLNLDDLLYRFDMGDSSSSWSVRRTLCDVLSKDNEKKLMIIFDEFQNASTIDSKGESVEKPLTRLVWELLDSGTFNDFRSGFYTFDKIQKLKLILESLLRKGVTVKNGVVTGGKMLFLDYLNIKGSEEILCNGKWIPRKESKGYLQFVQSEYIDSIIEAAWPRFKTEYDLRSFILTLNGKETLQFISEIYSMILTPITYDCRKSVVFVIGNLDRAYSMSGNYNPDMSADDFHAESLRINRSDIKKVLSESFRHEQIARLGNIHLIYPSLSGEAFRQIIQGALNTISTRYLEKHGILFEFSQSMRDMVYAEGVTPSLGVRPIQSTINQLIVSNLGLVINEMSKFRKPCNKAVFEAFEDSVSVSLMKDHEILGSMKYPIDLEMSKLRAIRDDDRQAIVAIHEAGHAVIDIVLLNYIPDRVFSRSASADLSGFVDIHQFREYHSAKTLKKDMIALFGGMAAEEIIFGHEHVTSGSRSDIERASRLAALLIRNCGMGSFPGAVNLPTPFLNDSYLDLDGKLNDEVKNLLQDSFSKSLKILNENIPLLLALATHLTENSCIDKKQILQLLSSQFPQLAANSAQSSFSYRDHLRRKCAAGANPQPHSSFDEMPKLVMNMDDANLKK